MNIPPTIEGLRHALALSEIRRKKEAELTEQYKQEAKRLRDALAAPIPYVEARWEIKEHQDEWCLFAKGSVQPLVYGGCGPDAKTALERLAGLVDKKDEEVERLRAERS